jgi:zinc/manganese transport system permease protein
MSDAIALLWPPFLMSLCLVGIHGYFGIQVLKRNVIFVDLALAQFAALGATVAFMLGHPAQGLETYLYSFASTLVAAILLSFTRAWSGRISQEALIGVIYVVAAAAAILLIDRAPQGAEHLKQILTGNILTTGLDELKPIVPLYAAIGLLHWALRSRLAAGHGHAGWDFIFYATFGLVVTSSVAVAGVLLVFSFLIVPAAIGVLYAERLSIQLAIGWIAGTVASAAGLAASFALDLPTGAAMVCAFGAALALAGILYPFLRGNRARALRRTGAILRWSAAAILAGSALQWMAAPRADQPLFDAAEYAWPPLRAAYLNPGEAAVYADAGEYAERYRREATSLNQREIASRARGGLDDEVVRRISSFVRSYGEMIKGEEFVMREVRARARERLRWAGGALFLALALLIVPGGAARTWRMVGLMRRRQIP